MFDWIVGQQDHLNSWSGGTLLYAILLCLRPFNFDIKFSAKSGLLFVAMDGYIIDSQV